VVIWWIATTPTVRNLQRREQRFSELTIEVCQSNANIRLGKTALWSNSGRIAPLTSRAAKARRRMLRFH
jgi:hypothetical protein